ncbi:hypothetical protein TEA_015604 [Camellia sinensis var. sinensis]|uniref:Uncharacterized protein n=1 Tax=Camellia sinensis var. sinensis TaxID=542762 RepID=A0A4S4D6D8_CAMSN|nr:hypothetical protein TEA_015604 [Camellia sinensis var. sinensis]
MAGESTKAVGAAVGGGSTSGNKMTTLEEYGTNLTKLAEEGKLDPVVERQPQIECVTQILGRRTKNNPCLIGEPGVGKTAVAEGLAQRIANGDVPETIEGKKDDALLDGTELAYFVRGQNKEKSISLKTMEDGQVLLYSNSVNAQEPKIPYPWLLFNDKVKVNSVFLRDSTVVSDSVLLLFGGKISRGSLDGHLRMLGGYLEFFMKPSLADTYLRLKTKLEELIQMKLLNSKLEIKNHNELLSTVRLLVSEDQCEGRFVFGRQPSNNKKLVEKGAAAQALQWLTGDETWSPQKAVDHMAMLLKKSKKKRQVNATKWSQKGSTGSDVRLFPVLSNPGQNHPSREETRVFTFAITDMEVNVWMQAIGYILCSKCKFFKCVTFPNYSDGEDVTVYCSMRLAFNYSPVGCSSNDRDPHNPKMILTILIAVRDRKRKFSNAAMVHTSGNVGEIGASQRIGASAPISRQRLQHKPIMLGELAS